MKKLLFTLWACVISLTLFAADLTGLKIYINPGHGGYDSDDRPIWTIPVPEMPGTLNPAGYFESKSNLSKGLALRDMLQAAGATVFMSRTANTTADDRNLSQIAAEANASNADAFLSIHSNALNTTTNYLLLLFRGNNNRADVPGSLEMAQASGPIQITNQLTVWTSANPMLRGDYDFYGTGQPYLGVLKPLTVPGFLSEGSFHDYPPETHRLCNDDYCKLEAYSFFRFYHTYFNREMPNKGVIAGFVKSENERASVLNEPKFTYVAGSHDQYLPLNAATVTLKDAGGTVLNTYTTDNWYNGIFAFYDLTPGSYQLTVQPAGSSYDPKTVDVTVEAGKPAYAKVFVKNKDLSADGTAYVDYPDPVQDPGITAVSQYDFEEALAAANPDWLQGTTIKRALFRNEKLYVLTTEPKILVVDATTGVKIKELDLTGVTGGSPVLSDIAFTADDYLVACNKETIPITSPTVYFKVYTWDDDDAAPTVLFQSQKQGNWNNGIVGETFAVSGRRADCKVYAPAKSGSTIRIVGLEYTGGSGEPASKYMGSGDHGTAASYTEAEWGANYLFTISRTGNGDYFYVDSPVLLPTEYQFDWSVADRSPLANKKVFAEKGGYVLGNTPSGFTIFRYAQHTYMASPASNADSTQVGVVLFDITDGLDQAVKVSVKYPENGLGAAKATYMAAAAKVTGVDIDLLILAQGQGMARYKTATKPTANIYASELSVTADNKLKFTLNENAQSVVITLVNSNGDVVKDYDAGALPKGVNEIAYDFSAVGVPLGSYSWRVTATARAVGMPAKISDDSPQFLFFSPRGVTVDNNPSSPFFGRVYVAEAAGGLVTEGAPDPSRTTQKGVYILNAAFEDVTNQQANAYGGGQVWGANTGTQYSPARVAVGPTGKVFINDSHKEHSGIYIMDPANPSANFVPVFNGTLDQSLGSVSGDGGVIHGRIIHSYVGGTAGAQQLFTFDLGATPGTTTISTGNIYRYDIGDLSTLPWTGVPSDTIYDDATNGNRQQNGNSCLAPDGRGGWWLSQYRANSSEAVPSLIHVTNGLIDYNSAGNIGQNGSLQGGMAVNTDGTLLALGTKAGEAEVYSIIYGANNVPTLTLVHTIKWSNANSVLSAAFDAADNLYLVSNGNERLMVYSLPKASNIFTTSAQMPYVVLPGLDPAKANVYASELSVTADKKYRFTLNDNTTATIITLYDNNTSASITSHNFGALPKGVHEVAYDFEAAGVPAGYYSWSITAQGATVENVTKVSDDSPQFLFYAPRGVAVDNSVESPFFGRVYVAEGGGGTVTVGSPDPSRTTQQGIYVLNAAFEDVTNQQANAYAGGIAWSPYNNTNYQYGPTRPAVAPDGKVYIPDSHLTNPGVWIMDPANPSAAFTPVFGGTPDAAGIVKNGSGVTIHNPVEDCYVSGSGTATQLFTFDRTNTPAVRGNIYRYDIGDLSALPWTNAPSDTIYEDAGRMANAYGSIAPDGRGGWWISQYRGGSGDAAIPTLIHVTDGNIDYNAGTTTKSSYQGGMAVNTDGTLLALGTKVGEAEVYSIIYGANNVPTLTLVHTINWWTTTSSYLTDLAFDAADNLYMVSNGVERLMVYSLPKAENSFTTPATALCMVGTLLDPAKANVYASELSRTNNAFKFTLNDNTTATIITLYDANDHVAATYNAGPLAKGAQTVTHDFTSEVTVGYTYSWSITAQGATVENVTKVSDDSPQFLFYAPRGVAVDNSVESPFFGWVYVAERNPNSLDAGADAPTKRKTQDGLYILNASLDDITNQGATAYKGGETWHQPSRLSVARDGKVYLGDAGANHPGVWIIDPASPSANFTPVFGAGVTGRISHSWIEGAGTDAKLFTLDAGTGTASYGTAVSGNIYRYDVGGVTLPWTSAPSATIYDDAANGNLQQHIDASIAPDGRDGWWIAQDRNPTTYPSSINTPSLMHVTPAGSVDYNSGADLNISRAGGMAVSVDGKLLAIGTAQGTVAVYEIAYDETTGIPTLTLLYSVPTGTSVNAAGVAFDAAGNLYAVDNNKERLRVYALPKAENSFTTPAQAIYDIAFASSAPPAPTVFMLENGNAVALRRTVDLTFTYSGGAPLEYRASETSDCSDASWQPYNPAALTYTFASDTHGPKTVYAQLRNDKGASPVLSDDILYKPLHPMSVTDFTVSSGAMQTNSRNVTLNHTVKNGVPAVYSASEDLSQVGTVWLPYVETPLFTLSEGMGLKEVYFAVASATDTSETVSDHIYLDESVTVDEHGLTAKLYPNPVETEVNVIIEEGYSETVDVTVYSITGVVYQRQTLSAPLFQLDLSRCPDGILLIKLSSGNNYTVKRVIKL
ncbi:MAG: N-acetylmuramoyl-L-alanine amidase [Prevotellaceae bacterium]|jgi:N-acetylmuramoyl-L-alanine amidase|nr:N-acetylmuramoyl-L-alanine amidase [Prevotellaceae bacterium]